MSERAEHDHLMQYATNRIVELESLLLVDVPEIICILKNAGLYLG